MQKTCEKMKELTRSEKRVVSKLINCMADKRFDEQKRRALNRALNQIYKQDSKSHPKLETKWVPTVLQGTAPNVEKCRR